MNKRIMKSMAPQRLCLLYVTMFVMSLILILSFVFHALLSRETHRESDDQKIVSTHTNKEDILRLPAVDLENPVSLKAHIKELWRIKVSVLDELRDIEDRYHKIKAGIDDETFRLSEIQKNTDLSELQLEMLRQRVESAQALQQQLARSRMPDIWAPLKLSRHLEITEIQIPSASSRSNCSMSSCFDFSKCSLLNYLHVYLYDDSNLADSLTLAEVLKNKNVLSSTAKLTNNVTQQQACLYLVVLNMTTIESRFKNNADALQNYIYSLPYWNLAGRNHIIFVLNEEHNSYYTVSLLKHMDFQEAILTTSVLRDFKKFRPKFDVMVTPIIAEIEPERSDGPSDSNHLWKLLPPLLPLRRIHLASFRGARPFLGPGVAKSVFQLGIEHLSKSSPQANDSLSFEFACHHNDVPPDVERQDMHRESWMLCDSEDTRYATLSQSIFSIVSLYPDPTIFRRIAESLWAGAIPVLIGAADVPLPFDELLDWSGFTIRIPLARLPELHFILRTFGESQLFELKRSGRLVFEQYFSSFPRSLQSVLALIRSRLMIHPRPAPDFIASNIYDNQPMPVAVMPYVPEIDEFLGPIELPYPSPQFESNYSSQTTSQLKTRWNVYPMLGVDTMFPHDPFRLPMPTDIAFGDSIHPFDPINDGAGGSGREFSESLGGNFPREQFTIVMLTYEREPLLIESLQRLNNLPYLNKIIVIWNSPDLPKSTLVWPKLTAQLEVLNPGKNSLNNRFLPYNQIETEAVLSLDDDAHLRHDEIIFGFRVWREARDRIVGFPGRFHAWDAAHKTWFYNSNYTCQLSMVLTGAAFFHKFYAFQYSHSMPAVIREKVDELMNCEDIAMNFLVSHITRKPPIKVTSRWTFRCPGCPETLSSNESHFTERHECIQFFTKVYGYNPLFYTQFRVDSILFKTRIPPTDQKCFKFI